MRSVQHDNRIKNYQINPITENNNLNRDCSCIMVISNTTIFTKTTNF